MISFPEKDKQVDAEIESKMQAQMEELAGLDTRALKKLLLEGIESLSENLERTRIVQEELERRGVEVDDSIDAN